MKSGNNSKPRVEVIVVVAILLFGGCLAARAASIGYSSGWSTGDSVSSGANVDGYYDYLNNTTSGDRYITQFDPALGTLQSIDVSFYSMALASSSSANFRDDDWLSDVGGYQQLYNMQLSVSMPGLNFNRYASTRSDTCSDTGGVTSGASCSTALSYFSQGLASLNTTISSAAALAGFTGTGSTFINIDQYATLYTNETDGDDGYVNSRSASVSTSGYFNITYNYSTIVPVPAAVWLFGSGLLGLFGISRRRKAS